MTHNNNIIYTNIAVFGGGSWGTALACHLSKQQQKVHLFLRSTRVIQEISEKKNQFKISAKF